MCILTPASFRNLGLQHSKNVLQSTKCNTFLPPTLFALQLLKNWFCLVMIPCRTYFRRYGQKSWLCPLFSFSNLTYSQKTSRKGFVAIISVNENKPRSERLFGTIYLKIVCSFSSNSIWKCLLFAITLEKSILFDSNSLKMLIVWYGLILFELWKSLYYLFVIRGLYELWKNMYNWVRTLGKYQYWYIWHIWKVCIVA